LDGPRPSWSTEGPVQAEVFVLRLRGTAMEMVGPCGPQPWYMEVGLEQDPVEVVGRLTRANLGPPDLVHSTSWRTARGGVVLSFVVVMPDDFSSAQPGIPIGRAELARSDATAAPAGIDAGQVIEHGLRHLAWLAADDLVVGEILSPDWRRLLSGYRPEPFRHLG
jgi:hypothetical protein